MKTRTVMAALAAALACALNGCASPYYDHEPVVATLGEDGGDIVLQTGQTLFANLYLREGTGLVWRIEQADLLAKLGYQGRFVGVEGRPLPAVVGHNEVVQQFAFEARRRGDGDLVFTLGPGRDPAMPPAKIATYRVHVR